MFKGPTYKASFYFPQQLFLKVLRQCGKSFGVQNTIKVFCHPSEKKKRQKHSVDNPHCRVNFSERFIIWDKNLTPLPELTVTCTCTDCMKQRSRMLWLSRLDWADPAQAWIHTVLRKSITFFIINIFLLIKTLSKMKSGQYPVWLGNPGMGTLRSKNPKNILQEPAPVPC